VENSLWRGLRTCLKTDYRKKGLWTCLKTDYRKNKACVGAYLCAKCCWELHIIFSLQTGRPVSRCDISVYTCYYQCKCGGLKNTNSGACTLKQSVGRRKRTQLTGRSPTGQRSVAERNEENDTAFHLVTGVKMFYSRWNRKQMRLQPTNQ
jgi:hypothetical protein